jgi:hypothetical protein
VQGLRNAAVVDPCLALADARNILTSNADDAAMHRNAVGYIGPILINVLSGVILGLATKHWDFAGHGSEGVSELVGIGLGELQTFTYPHGGHVKVGATSLTVSF